MITYAESRIRDLNCWQFEHGLYLAQKNDSEVSRLVKQLEASDDEIANKIALMQLADKCLQSVENTAHSWAKERVECNSIVVNLLVDKYKALRDGTSLPSTVLVEPLIESMVVQGSESWSYLSSSATSNHLYREVTSLTKDPLLKNCPEYYKMVVDWVEQDPIDVMRTAKLFRYF